LDPQKKRMFVGHPFVARGGLEPPHTVPKTAVLPLDDRAIISVYFSQDAKITSFF
jgi:hypothetical protein